MVATEENDVAAGKEPQHSNKANDVYLWSAYGYGSPQVGSLDPAATMQRLCEAAGGWKELRKPVASKNAGFGAKVLTVMRKLMNLPEHYERYWETSPWLEPTQQWVADQIREFAKWYLRNIGDPKW